MLTSSELTKLCFLAEGAAPLSETEVRSFLFETESLLECAGLSIAASGFLEYMDALEAVLTVRPAGLLESSGLSSQELNEVLSHIVGALSGLAGMGMRTADRIARAYHQARGFQKEAPHAVKDALAALKQRVASRYGQGLAKYGGERGKAAASKLKHRGMAASDARRKARTAREKAVRASEQELSTDTQVARQRGRNFARKLLGPKTVKVRRGWPVGDKRYREPKEREPSLITKLRSAGPEGQRGELPKHAPETVFVDPSAYIPAPAKAKDSPPKDSLGRPKKKTSPEEAILKFRAATAARQLARVKAEPGLASKYGFDDPKILATAQKLASMTGGAKRRASKPAKKS